MEGERCPRPTPDASAVALSQDVGVSGTSGTNSRRGWHSLDSRLAQGDTLVVVSIDRIGRRWLDTMGFAAWVSEHQELVWAIRRRTRTKAGLEKAKADGKKLGAPRRLSEEQEAAVIEMVGSGVSQRRVARSFGVSPATVRRAVKRE